MEITIYQCKICKGYLRYKENILNHVRKCRAKLRSSETSASIQQNSDQNNNGHGASNGTPRQSNQPLVSSSAAEEKESCQVKAEKCDRNGTSPQRHDPTPAPSSTADTKNPVTKDNVEVEVITLDEDEDNGAAHSTQSLTTMGKHEHNHVPPAASNLPNSKDECEGIPVASDQDDLPPAPSSSTHANNKEHDQIQMKEKAMIEVKNLSIVLVRIDIPSQKTVSKRKPNPPPTPPTDKGLDNNDREGTSSEPESLSVSRSPTDADVSAKSLQRNDPVQVSEENVDGADIYGAATSRRSSLRQRKPSIVNFSSALDTAMNKTDIETQPILTEAENAGVANSRRSSLRTRENNLPYFPTRNRARNKDSQKGMPCNSDSSLVSSFASAGNVKKDAPNKKVKNPTELNVTETDSARRSTLRMRKQNPVYFPTNKKTRLEVQCKKSSPTRTQVRRRNPSQGDNKKKPKVRQLKRRLRLQNKVYAEDCKHRCQYCPARFRHSNHLQIHIRIHTGEKPYKCEYCPKAFAQITNCNNHMRIHTNERPFVCKICKRGFTQVTNLTFHERLHEGVMPYECDRCGKKFTQIGNRDSHRKSYHP